MTAIRLGLLATTVILLTGSCSSGDDRKDVGMSDSTPAHAHTNRLIDENSPYLLSHAHNPVDWYPWGDEALQRARDENKPIFLSIGYAACHWCHVMERESFENDSIAAILNESFVAIKVDREQRPDLDQIYMSFTTAMTGSGGWPMSVFLTPDLKPFFAGTYFPPESAYNRPGFGYVLTEIARMWVDSPEQVIESSQAIFDQVNQRLSRSFAESPLTPDLIRLAAGTMIRNVDPTYGGIGSAPKFPHALEQSFFLRHYRDSGDLSYLQAAEKALGGMARGGIYDQLGGGFARYSVDARWLVPHFEKMLYDNALLVPVYVEAYQVTGKKLYRDIVTSTLDFMIREMSHDNGGFFSALDADSEGEEGKYYVWDKAEIDSLLGNDAPLFCEFYNVTDSGNFEGRNILNVDSNSDRLLEREDEASKLQELLQRGRATLLDARRTRVRPLTDDKILTSWNGLAVSAFCRGYQITGDTTYLDRAVKAASFIHDSLCRDSRLTHSYREGRHSDGQFLEDYAFFVRGLIDLFESDRSSDNARWLTFARELSDTAITSFMDDNGTFYLRDADQQDLIVRPKDETDGSLPAPGSIMIQNLLKLARLTDDNRYEQTATKALTALSGSIAQFPTGMTSAVCALDFLIKDKLEIVVVGDGPQRDAMLDEIYSRFLPNRVIAISPDADSSVSPLFADRADDDNAPRAYVCVNSTCNLPAETAEQLKAQLDAL